MPVRRHCQNSDLSFGVAAFVSAAIEPTWAPETHRNWYNQHVGAKFAGLLHGLPVSVRFHFFGLPVSNLAGFGVKCNPVQKDFFL